MQINYCRMFKLIKFIAVFAILFNIQGWAQQANNVKFIYDFEKPIQNSALNCKKEECKVEILPRLCANESKSTSRVYLETKFPIKDNGSLGMIPISNFNPEIEIKFDTNIANLDAIKVYFQAKSLKNGKDTDTKYARLFYSISYNKGVSYDESLFLANFPNTNSEVANYQFTLPSLSYNAKNIAIKLLSRRSIDSSGACAKIIIDDLTYELILGATLANENQFFQHSIVHKITSNSIFFNSPQSGLVYNKLGQLVATFNDLEEVDMTALHNDYYLIYCNSINSCIKFLKME